MYLCLLERRGICLSKTKKTVEELLADLKLSAGTETLSTGFIQSFTEKTRERREIPVRRYS